MTNDLDALDAVARAADDDTKHFHRTFSPSRILSLTAEIRGLREALEWIAANCDMTRKQFVMLGPDFACRQVERAFLTARAALAQGER